MWTFIYPGILGQLSQLKFPGKEALALKEARVLLKRREVVVRKRSIPPTVHTKKLEVTHQNFPVARRHWAPTYLQDTDRSSPGVRWWKLPGMFQFCSTWWGWIEHAASLQCTPEMPFLAVPADLQIPTTEGLSYPGFPPAQSWCQTWCSLIMGAVLKLLINMMKLKCHSLASPTLEGRIGFLTFWCITFTKSVPEHVFLVRRGCRGIQPSQPIWGKWEQDSQEPARWVWKI